MPGRDRQGLPIRLVSGIDTKDDALVQTEMLAVENGTFQAPGSLHKRYGMTRLALPSSLVRKIAVYNNELLAIADDGIFSRLTDPADGWSGSKGFPALSRTTETTVSSDFQNNTTNGGSDNRGMVLGDIAVAGGMCFCAWIEYNTGQNQCYVTIFDIATGAQYISHALAGSVGQGKQVRWTRNLTNVLLYVGGNTTSLAVFVFSSLTAPTALPAPTVVTFTDSPVGPFDLAVSSTLTTVAVMAEGAAYKDIRVTNGTPTQGGGTSIATATNTVRQVAIYTDPTNSNRYWVVWSESDGAATTVIKLTACSIGGGSLATTVTVATFTNSTQPVNVGVVWSAANSGPVVFWEDDLVAGEAKRLQHRQYSFSGTTLTALAAAQLTMLWGEMLSRPFLVGGVPYIWAANMSLPVNGIPFYASAFLLRIDTTDLSATPKARVVAKSLHRTAPSRLNNQSVYTATPSQIALDGTDVLILAPKLIGTSGVFAQNAAYAPTVVRTSLSQTVDVAQLTKSLTLGASLLQSYDGAQLVELNHLAPPEQVAAASTGTGGSLVNGAYLYVAVYEWVDANGEIHQSLPSAQGTITLAGGTSTQQIQLSCRAPLLTAKAGIVVRFYVSLANQQTLFASAVGDASLAGVFGSATTGLISMNVSSIGTAPLYSQAALSNDAPQPTNFLVRASDRLWGHAGQGVLEMSKTRIVTHAGEFSPLLSQQLTSFLTPNALAELSGNRLAVFADEAIAAFDGSGPDNTGSGIFNDDELINRSIGCKSQAELVRATEGIFFRSKKGYYLLTDGLDVQYVGAKVEAYNALASAGLAVDPVSNRIKAALQGAGNPLLVLDTFSQTWSTEISTAGIDCRSIVFWRDRMELLDAAGFLWEQTPGLFTDNSAAVIMRGRTGWIAPAGFQGFSRVRHIFLQGAKKSDHNLIVNLRFDFKETIVETHTINAGPAVAANDDYQWRVDVSNQKCKSLSIEFFDDYTGLTPGEGYSLNEIVLDASVEGSFNPRAATRIATRSA